MQRFDCLKNDSLFGETVRQLAERDAVVMLTNIQLFFPVSRIPILWKRSFLLLKNMA